MVDLEVFLECKILAIVIKNLATLLCLTEQKNHFSRRLEKIEQKLTQLVEDQFQAPVNEAYQMEESYADVALKCATALTNEMS